MNKPIDSNDACQLTASSHPSGDGAQVLKHSDTFAVFDRLGEAGSHACGDQGLFHLGTRHLAQWELSVEGQRPMMLNSTMKQDNSLLVVQMTTPDLKLPGDQVLAHGTLHIFRALTIQKSAFHEQCRLTNYSRQPLELQLEYRFGTDFKDIFEVRGATRQRRGEDLAPEVNHHRVVLSYRGLDAQSRSSEIEFDGEGDVVHLESGRCVVRVRLDAGAHRSLNATVKCHSSDGFFHTPSHAAVMRKNVIESPSEDAEQTRIFTSNEQFNEWINRSRADLQMLVSETTYGSYPYAGVPWFATPFGRDGLITALETLWLQPRLTRGVLNFLAATQANELDPESEAEPGKIVHEMRDGEMAALGEVPFRRYYGTVDATPLFVILAGQYYRRTGDGDFIDHIWPNIRRAMRWIDEYGDYDGDGFVEYEAHNARGLVHQCWKDSNDSVFHADGSEAVGPIAASEVQGYVYQAKQLAAELADMRQEKSWATELRQQAKKLKGKFQEAFWINSIDTYAIALDGKKRPCTVRNSNAGHLLYSGIVEDRYAQAVCRSLTNERAYNGWGIRTISEGEARYNPMSYHNGSVWPHDTAIGAAGLSRYRFREETLQVATGLFDASMFNELHRLPELFCGFKRLAGHSPTLYPVACSPQAWAAGSVFMVLQAMLGLTFAPHKPQVRFDTPLLPSYLQWVRIQNLRIGDGVVDLALRRHPRDVGLNVERKEGDISIIVSG